MNTTVANNPHRPPIDPRTAKRMAVRVVAGWARAVEVGRVVEVRVVEVRVEARVASMRVGRR